MNKAQLVEAIAAKTNKERLTAAQAVDAVLSTIIEATVKGDRVSVTGFGSFEKVDRPARYARNPQTGERVRVKKTSAPRFRPGQGFKDLVSGAKQLPTDVMPIKKSPKRVRLTDGTLVSATSRKGKAELKRRAAAKRSATAPKAPAKTTAKKAASKAPAKKATVRKAPVKKTTAKKATSKRASRSTGK